MKINFTGVKDNMQHVAGLVIGCTLLRVTGLRYDKIHRGTKWFSTVAANLSADREAVDFAPFRMGIKGIK